MPSKNSENPKKGKAFQELSGEVMDKHFSEEFLQDEAIPIGLPPKNHRFDLVSADFKYIGECKNYSWTETGNIPSAKLTALNEAVFYLTFVPSTVTRFIVMRKDKHPKKQETLAEYYYRINRHLLGNIMIFEIDEKTKKLREIKGE